MKHLNVAIAADHAGFDLKTLILSQGNTFDSGLEIDWLDLGTTSSESVDYPSYADKLCRWITTQPNTSRGILICGSGIGMSIRANRFAKVRAALCLNPQMGELARQHNDANVLCLGARLSTGNEALQTVKRFLQTPFEGGRHQRRVDLLDRPAT